MFIELKKAIHILLIWKDGFTTAKTVAIVIFKLK